MSRALILALCLCLAGAAAVRAAAVEDAAPFCPGAGEGMPGGYTMITSKADVPEDVLDFLEGRIREEVMVLMGNTTWMPCDDDVMQKSWEACSQVVAGTNYQVRLNLTCPTGVAGENNTLGLEAHVYWPLPGSNEEPEAHVEVLFEPTAEDAEDDWSWNTSTDYDNVRTDSDTVRTDNDGTSTPDFMDNPNQDDDTDGA